MDAAGTAGDDESEAPKRGARGGGREPVDSKTRSRVRRLAREGKSRNSIAREVGISPSSVSRICASARPPISFDRSAARAATEAVLTDLKAQRAQLAIEVLDEAKRVMAKFQAPHIEIGWYQGFASEHVLAGPRSGDVKNYAIALGVLLDKHLTLVKHDSDDRDLPAVDKWLAAMLGGSA